MDTDASALGALTNHPEPPAGPGSRVFMARCAQGRHPSTVALVRQFAYAHLDVRLVSVSEPFSHLARTLLDILPDGPELTVCLRKLIEAKNCAVVARVDALDDV